MNAENSEEVQSTNQQLYEQNQALQREVEMLNEHNKYAWSLYAETSRKLQLYSASIKAAVSSLLDREIFWDSANQFEFFKTIDTSVSQVSELTVLMTLAFLAEANSLVLQPDPHMLQEILSVTQEDARHKLTKLALEVSFPVEGKPCLVDYEYLSKALLLLCEVSYSLDSTQPIAINATAGDEYWYLEYSGLGTLLTETIDQMHNCRTQIESIDLLSAENILRLHIACEVFHLQSITVEVVGQPGLPPVLRLGIPVVVSN